MPKMKTEVSYMIMESFIIHLWQCVFLHD